MAGRWSQLGEILTGMGQAPARVSAFLESLDPATAAKLMQAAEAGDNRALLKAMADQTWGTSPARPQPVGPGRGETREPVSGRQWTQRPDSYVRGQVQANSEMVPPELMARIQSGDPEALNEAYAGIVRRMERAERAPRQRELPMDEPPAQITGAPASPQAEASVYGKPFNDDPEMLRSAHSAMRDNYPVPYDTDANDILDPSILGDFTPDQQALMRELANNNWLGFDYPSQAANAVLSPEAHSWEMTQGLADARNRLIRGYAKPSAVEDSIRSLARPSIADQFDAAFRADVMPARATDPGASTLPYGQRAAMNPPRAPETPFGALMDTASRNLQSEADRLASQLRGIQDDLRGMRAPDPVRTPDSLPDPPKRSFDYRPAAAMAAGAGAVGAGLALLNQDTPSLTSTGGTADLAAEATPPPGVMSAEDEFTDRFKRQFTDREQRRADDGSLQARILIDRLNDMRRKAGGEVPEAPQMMAEINRLLAKGNAQVRQPDFRPGDKASRYRQQAQNLINRLNDMRREAGGEVPQAKQIMAEVQKLQSMADQMRNAG